MSKFKPGDRVRYVGTIEPPTPKAWDDMVVVGPHPVGDSRVVTWAPHANPQLSYFSEDDLELAPDPRQEAIEKVVKLLCDELSWPGMYARKAAEILADAGLLQGALR